MVQQADQPNDIIVSEGVQPQLVVGDGLQYQQQYIIRHEPPPQPPPRPEFQQQQPQPQQQQQHQQQALHRHQVSSHLYYILGLLIAYSVRTEHHGHLTQEHKSAKIVINASTIIQNSKDM